MKSLVKLGFGSMIEVRVVEAIDNNTQEDLSIHYVYIMNIIYILRYPDDQTRNHK